MIMFLTYSLSDYYNAISLAARAMARLDSSTVPMVFLNGVRSYRSYKTICKAHRAKRRFGSVTDLVFSVVYLKGMMLGSLSMFSSNTPSPSSALWCCFSSGIANCCFGVRWRKYAAYKSSCIPSELRTKSMPSGSRAPGIAKPMGTVDDSWGGTSNTPTFTVTFLNTQNIILQWV